MSKMQKTKDHGGLALPSTSLYYQATLLENLMQWWNPNDKLDWELEQFGVITPLIEWTLTMKS